MVCVPVPFKLKVLEPAVSVPSLVMFPPMLWVNVLALKVVPLPTARFPMLKPVTAVALAVPLKVKVPLMVVVLL